MSQTQILIRFKQLLVSFNDELISQFPSEPDFKLGRVMLNTPGLEKFLIDQLVEHFGRTDIDIRRLVADRDENYFRNNNPFTFISDERAAKMVMLWDSGILDQVDKDVMWVWVDAFLLVADKYRLATC
jgi:hypothetical protein